MGAMLRSSCPLNDVAFLGTKTFPRRYPASYPRRCRCKQAVRPLKVVACCHLASGQQANRTGKLSRRNLSFVRTLLIDNYDSYTYNIYQELAIVNGVPPVVVRNDELTWEDIRRFLYEDMLFDNVVISPGPGTPLCPSDIGICLRVLLECRDIPILGICLGHQALGLVHGARVIHATQPIHGRLSELVHNGSTLFHGLPSGRNSGFKVVRYHSLVVDAETLPNELVPIAWTSSATTHSIIEINGGNARNGYGVVDGCSIVFSDVLPKLSTEKMARGSELMGIMHSTRPHYGLQFHPESVGTSHGRRIFQNFRDITEDHWQTSKVIFAGDSDVCLQVPNGNNLFKAPTSISNAFDNYLTSNGSGFEKPELMFNGNLKSIFSLPEISRSEINPVRLRWRKLERLAARIGGAKRIFQELYGNSKAENTFWLDSSSTEKERARFSFMGGSGGLHWKQITYRLSDEESWSNPLCKGYLFVTDATGATSTTVLEKGFFYFLNKELQSFCYDDTDFEGLPFEFFGGYVGYIGYNLKAECGASNRHKTGTPDACLVFADNFLVIDHQNNDIYIMSVQPITETSSISSWLSETEQKLHLLESRPEKASQKNVSGSSSSKTGFVPEKSREQYMNDVRECLNYIKNGESYELCLTTQLRQSVEEIDPIKLYFSLRETNPAPYSAWMNFSTENLSICCSSPERFLRLDKNGILEAKPIKGTIARSSNEEEDERNKLQLQYSEKDQAENLMIVDLLRNDLGRVCEPGSVHVPVLMDVESYSTVHTMVSTVRGVKNSSASAIDCVQAVFPGGSMTGAPKLRSMEIIDALENCSRGIYSGSIGFFSINQTFDLNIVIRTIVIHQGEASIGAGGAVIALSNPQHEFEEMMLKTKALTNVFQTLQPHGKII